MSLSPLSGLHPDVRRAAEDAVKTAEYYRIPVTVTSGFRSYDEQAALRRRYLAGNSRFPANPPGMSAHEYGLAFDSVVDPQWQPAWDWIRQYYGFKTLPSDIVHAEVPGWRSYVFG